MRWHLGTRFVRHVKGIRAEVLLVKWEHSEATLCLPCLARAQLCCLEPCSSETLTALRLYLPV